MNLSSTFIEEREPVTTGHNIGWFAFTDCTQVTVIKMAKTVDWNKEIMQ